MNFGLKSDALMGELSNYLDINSIENYMIEIGGEVKTKGKNADGEKWIIGLSDFVLNIGNINTIQYNYSPNTMFTNNTTSSTFNSPSPFTSEQASG